MLEAQYLGARLAMQLSQPFFAIAPAGYNVEGSALAAAHVAALLS